MIRIFDIAAKDLLQLMRDRKTFMFLLIMPIAFTLLFGFAFGAFNKTVSDPRLPVGFLDNDNTWLSHSLHDQLAASEVIRLEEYNPDAQAEMESKVSGEKLAAAIIVPARYSHAVLNGQPARLILYGDTSSTAGTSVESEALTTIIHVENAVRTALILEQVVGDQKTPFDYTYKKALDAWQDPPIRVAETTSSIIPKQDNGSASLAHTAPGMMLQFGIAGLLTCAQVLVSERKSRCLQRLLTTDTARVHVLLGHFLAIFVLIFCQFLVLLSFGQYILGVKYLNVPQATLLVAISATLCISAMGLLIGTFARTEEQAIMFALIPMFVFAGLGGAWVPLEVTGPTFQAIGHVSPIAWAMDGFKNISIRGLGLQSVFVPCAALVGYALLFFILAAWKFYTAQER